MEWKYAAEEVIPPKLSSFIPFNTIAVFFVLLLITLIFLFPKKSIIKQLFHVSNPYPVAMIYLQNLIQQDPVNLDYRALLANQDIGLGYWHDARRQLDYLEKTSQKSDTTLQHRILWLNFNLNLALTQQMKPNTFSRSQSEKLTYGYLKQLIPITQGQEALSSLATDALGLNHPEIALVIYQKILDIYPVQSNTMVAKVAQTALMSQAYAVSGELYFKAAHLAVAIPVQREYILLGLQAYQADQLYTAGFKQLNGFNNPAIFNQSLLIFLTYYSLAAGKPEIAEKYITQVLVSKGGDA